MPNKTKHAHKETHVEESIRLSDEAAQRREAMQPEPETPPLDEKPARLDDIKLPTRDTRCLQVRHHIPMCDCVDRSPIVDAN